MAVRKNEFTHFSRPDAGFRCALCAQRASEAGRPEAMDCVIRVAAGSCLLSKSCRIRRSRVQGGAPLPGGVWGKAPTELFPVKFLFVYAFNQGSVSLFFCLPLFLSETSRFHPSPRGLLHRKTPSAIYLCKISQKSLAIIHAVRYNENAALVKKKTDPSESVK